MGCTFSGSRHAGDGDVRSFKVHNVNDQGMELNRGHIEIRDNNLVLYQKGKEPIRWPLRCLRRYGFEEELFSFESGRRCATGPGIYAFKCSHAESLFHLVQEMIQRAGEEDHRGQQQQQHQQQQLAHTHVASPVEAVASNRLRPISTMAPAEHNPETYGVFVNEGSLNRRRQNGSAHQYVNGIVGDNNGHDYMNTGTSVSGAFQINEAAALIDFLHNPPGVAMAGANRSQVNYAELETMHPPASMQNLLDQSGNEAVHNVTRRSLHTQDSFENRLSQYSLGAEGSRLSMPNEAMIGASLDNESIQQSLESDVFQDGAPEGMVCPSYVNLNLDDGGASGLPPLFDMMVPTAQDLTSNYTNQPKLIVQTNYITIDHQNNDNMAGGIGGGGGGAGNVSPTSPTSMCFPESPGYARIDFDRTVALSNTARPVAADNEGGRKTRHNSTISDMPG